MEGLFSGAIWSLSTTAGRIFLSYPSERKGRVCPPFISPLEDLFLGSVWRMSAVCLLHPMNRETGFPCSCKHTHCVHFQHSQSDYLFVDIGRAAGLISITSLFSCIHSWSTQTVRSTLALLQAASPCLIYLKLLFLDT